MRRLIFCGIIILMSLSACSGLKQSGSNLYTSFYVGEKGTQYFIKPLYFSNKESEKLNTDFTFRFQNTINKSDTARIII